jgi:hypothetical protein
MLPPIVECPGRCERNYQFNPTLLMLAGSMFKRDPAPRTSFSRATDTFQRPRTGAAVAISATFPASRPDPSSTQPQYRLKCRRYEASEPVLGFISIVTASLARWTSTLQPDSLQWVLHVRISRYLEKWVSVKGQFRY